jgi:hypothetical protein
MGADMILCIFESVSTSSVDWGLFAIMGSRMPPRDPNDDEEEEEEEDEEEEEEEDEEEEEEDEEDEDFEPPVVREPEPDE